MIVGQAGAEDFLVAGRRSELVLELPDEGQVDILLIHDQAVQLDHRHLGRHRVKAVPNQRVLQKFDQERFVL